jgi:hypothetical protein
VVSLWLMRADGVVTRRMTGVMFCGPEWLQ